MKIDLVKHINSTYKVSIKDKFTSNLKDDCPLISYSIAKVIDKNSQKSIGLSDCLILFNLDTLGIFSVFQSIQSYKNYLIYVQAENIYGVTGGDD